MIKRRRRDDVQTVRRFRDGKQSRGLRRITDPVRAAEPGRPGRSPQRTLTDAIRNSSCFQHRTEGGRRILFRYLFVYLFLLSPASSGAESPQIQASSGAIGSLRFDVF